MYRGDNRQGRARSTILHCVICQSPTFCSSVYHLCMLEALLLKQTPTTYIYNIQLFKFGLIRPLLDVGAKYKAGKTNVYYKSIHKKKYTPCELCLIRPFLDV